MKSGGAVEALGTRITLHITDPSDMTRDLLKVAYSSVHSCFCLEEVIILLFENTRNPVTPLGLSDPEEAFSMTRTTDSEGGP